MSGDTDLRPSNEGEAPQNKFAEAVDSGVWKLTGIWTSDSRDGRSKDGRRVLLSAVNPQVLRRCTIC